MQGTVFSIEEFSLYDGHGIRTTVFLSGCPLKCEWCHNPEGQEFSPFIIRSKNGCLNCGECFKAGGGKLTEKSVSACPNNLLRYSAQCFTPENLAEFLLKNQDVLNSSGGGITVSGGEPLCQSEFVVQLFNLLKGKVNRAVQTSGYCDAETFKEVLNHTDFVLFDIKLVDEKAHIRYTKKSNKKILDNYKTLVESGVPFITRTPLIPTVTDTAENIKAIAELLAKNEVNEIELLPYNNLTASKYPIANKIYNPSFDDKAEVSFHTEIFDYYKIAYKIL